MIHLLIVDRLQTMCETMVAVLREEPDICVVGVATTPGQGLALLSGCDMVLVTANLPEDGAIDFIHAVSRVDPHKKVLAMDVKDGQSAAAYYMDAGAADCVLENESVEELLSKVRAIYRGAQMAQPVRA